MPRTDCYEPPLPCVLDVHDVDRLLERLRAFHGEPRADIAPELLRDRLVVKHRVNHVVARYDVHDQG